MNSDILYGLIYIVRNIHRNETAINNRLMHIRIEDNALAQASVKLDTTLRHVRGS